MRFHRLPRAREYMGEFWLPPLPGRDTERPKSKKQRDRRKRKTRAEYRRELKKALATKHPRPPDRDTCYSIDCIKCGRTWLSAIRPIKPNTERGGTMVYVCDICRR